MDAESVTAYRCSVCKRLFDDSDDAFACHGASEPAEGYACSRCGTIYALEEDAENCCRAGRF